MHIFKLHDNTKLPNMSIIYIKTSYESCDLCIQHWFTTQLSMVHLCEWLILLNKENFKIQSKILCIAWCLPCIFFFLSQSEKSSLGALVYSPFTNHNRSKKLLEKHSKIDSHLWSVDCAYIAKSYRICELTATVLIPSWDILHVRAIYNLEANVSEI